MSPLLSSFPFVQGGSAGTPLATVTSTTGSPTVDTSSRPGKTIYKFTGSGSITVGVAGTCEYLVIGGGAVNGAGGLIYNTSAVLPAGTLTVTIGAGIGFAGATNGGSSNPSRLGDVVALGGGFVDFNYSGGTMVFTGGSAGGSRVTATNRSAALSGAQGNNGGAGTTGMMGPAMTGGGGGAGAVGGNSPNGTTGGNGGAGSANSITGSSVTYAAGAGGYGSSTLGTPTGNGTANTGNGGSQTGDGSSTNTGGSGFVVVVIG
jgi:hypothetical protein